MTRVVILLVVACVGVVIGFPKSSDSQTKDIDFLMPKVQPHEPDTYLCNTMELDRNDPTYVVGFKPHANMKIAHHMLLYGCTEPGQKKDPWVCGEMAASNRDKFKNGPVCKSGSQIIYAWAMDAPSLKLPSEVAFKIGGNTNIKYLVLQVHYKDVTSFLPPESKTDSSGITLEITEKPMPNRAGVYLMGTAGRIPAHSVEYMETDCPVRDNVIAYPFAFRTHTHTLGKVVAGYRIRNQKWEEIGRKDPHLPQMFYNVTHPGMTIRNGDLVAARCTMDNEKDHDVSVGATQNDEMCNFYIMYYVKGDKLLNNNQCWSGGPPFYYWERSANMKERGVEEPPLSASIVPGQKKDIKKSQPKVYGFGQSDLFESLQKRRRISDRYNDDIARLLAKLDSQYEPEYKAYDRFI